MEAPKEVEPEVIDLDDIEESEKESCLVGSLLTEKNLNTLNYGSLNLVATSAKIGDKIEEALPHDIVENILSRLPVKCLLRFKKVCKMWKATISDPGFAEIHLQRYKNATSRDLLACEIPIADPRFPEPLHERESNYTDFSVAEIQAHNVKFVSRIETSWKTLLNPSHILGNCDGLYLIRCFQKYSNINMFVVWNPSCRKYIEVWCPHPMGCSYTLKGIYYNPLMKDYKVLFADSKHYAVFSCKCSKWGEVKETKGICLDHEIPFDDGVSCNGSLYWRHTLSYVGSGRGYEFEIIWFDGKDEEFKKLPTPNCKGVCFQLTSFGGNLCLQYRPNFNEIGFMKKDDKDSWVDFNVKLQPNLLPPGVIMGPFVLRLVSEDEILLIYYDTINAERIYIIYDLNISASVRIQRDPSKDLYHPVPYLENLFIQ